MSFRALIIDDEPEVSNLIKLLLQQHFEVEVEIAATCAEARHKLAEKTFDLITLDHQLPDGSGLEILEELQSEATHPPVIMVTGHGDERIALSAFKFGASGYVVKDARMSTLFVQEVRSAFTSVALEGAERELDRIKERYLQMFENMTSGVAIYEPVGAADDFIIRDFNSAAEQIDDIERSSVIGKRVTEAFPGIYDMGFLKVLQRVARTGKPQFYPAVYYEDDRRSGWRENRVYKLPTGEVVAIYDDVTEPKTAEAKLIEANQRLEDLLSSTRAVLYTAEAFGNYGATFITDNVKPLFGYDPEQFYAEKFWFDHLHPDDQVIVGNNMEMLLEEGLHSYEYRFRDAFGNYRWIKDEMRLIRDPEGKPEKIVGFFIDNTECKKAEQNLLERNKELEGYAQAISHDLKSPLTSALTGCSVLEDIARTEDLGKLGPQMIKAVETTRSAVERALALIEDLLTFVEIGKAPELIEAVDVSRVVEEVLEEHRQEIGEKGIKVKVTGDMGVLKASPVHIYQVLSNLIVNAIEHGKSSAPQIEISGLGEAEGGGRAYRVRDNGPGLSEDVELPFELFSKKDSRGTGMGLSIVKKVIDLYNGEISVSSDGGACFEFVIRGLD